MTEQLHKCLILHPKLPSGRVEGRQLQQHGIQSAQMPIANTLAKHQYGVEKAHVAIRVELHSEKPLSWHVLNHHCSLPGSLCILELISRDTCIEDGLGVVGETLLGLEMRVHSTSLVY